MFSIVTLTQTLKHLFYQQKLSRIQSTISFNFTNFSLLKILFKYNLILGFSKNKKNFIVLYNTLSIFKLIKNIKFFSKPKLNYYISYSELKTLVKQNPFSIILLLNNSKLETAKTVLNKKKGGVLIAIIYI